MIENEVSRGQRRRREKDMSKEEKLEERWRTENGTTWQRGEEREKEV